MTENELKETVSRLEAVAAQLSEQQRHPREYIDSEEAAAFLGLSKIQLEEWRSRHTGGPAFHKVGRRVVYAVADLRMFMSAHRQEPML